MTIQKDSEHAQSTGKEIQDPSPSNEIHNGFNVLSDFGSLR